MMRLSGIPSFLDGFFLFHGYFLSMSSSRISLLTPPPITTCFVCKSSLALNHITPFLRRETKRKSHHGKTRSRATPQVNFYFSTRHINGGGALPEVE